MVALPPDAESQLVNIFAGIVLNKVPFAMTPIDLMVVTAIVPGGVRCRHSDSPIDNGYTYPCLASYTPRQVGDKVLVLRIPGEPVVADRIDTR